MATYSFSGVAANPDLTLFKFDYEKDSSKRLVCPKFRIGKLPCKVEFSASVYSGSGIVCTSFGEGKTAKEVFTLPIQFDYDEDLKAIETISDLVKDLIPDPDDFELSPLVKEETLFLKLKPDSQKKAFTVKTNIKLDPKKPAEVSFSKSDPVTIIAELGAWFNFEDKRYGLSLTPLSLNFENEIPTQPVKKQRFKKE